MLLIFSLLYIAILLLVVALLIRVIYDWVQNFAKYWKPTGISLFVAEVVYSISDVPLKFVRKFVPSLRLGGISFDIAFLLIFILCYMFMGILGNLIR